MAPPLETTARPKNYSPKYYKKHRKYELTVVRCIKKSLFFPHLSGEGG